VIPSGRHASSVDSRRAWLNVQCSRELVRGVLPLEGRRSPAERGAAPPRIVSFARSSAVANLALPLGPINVISGHEIAGWHPTEFRIED